MVRLHLMWIDEPRKKKGQSHVLGQRTINDITTACFPIHLPLPTVDFSQQSVMS